MSDTPTPEPPPLGAPPAPAAPASLSPLKTGIYALLALAWLPAHFLASLAPPRALGSVHLDSSWQQLVAHDFVHTIQAGVDHVFTYGPLGYFLAGHAEYAPELFWQKCGAEAGIRGIIAIATLLPTLCMPALWQRVVFMILALVVAPVASDASILVGLTMATSWVVLRGRGLALSLPLACLFAAAGLGKFTYMMLGIASVGLMSLALLSDRKVRSALALPFGFAAAVVLFWVILGQSIANLPAFFRGSMEIASGYNESMRLSGPVENTLIALATVGLIGLGYAWVALRRPRQMRQLLAAGLACLSLFLLFKSGYVRQDEGHERIFYSGALVIAALIWAFPGEGPRNRFVHLVVLLTTISAGIGLDWTWKLPMHVYEAGRQNWIRVQNPGAMQAELDEILEKERQKYDLPKLREIVGDARIDQVPHDQGILFFNDLNVHHRPIFQSYSAYTPYLQTLNGAFYEDDAKAPQFVLFRINGIDSKLPTIDDSQIYRVLLRRYRPRTMDGAFALFERRPEAGLAPVAGQPGAELVQEATVRVGEWVELKGIEDLGLLALDLEPTLAGKVWTTAFRGSRLSLDVRFKNGDEHAYGTSHRAIQTPFLLNPHTPDSRAFIQLFTDERPKREVVAVRLVPRRNELYEETYRLRYWRAPMPKPLAPDDPLVNQILSPDFSPRPASMQPDQNFSMASENGLSVQLAEPTSAVTFRLAPGRFTAAGSFGLLSKVPDGGSDGVLFRIEKVDASGSATPLFERALETVPADRGPQKFTLTGDAQPGDTLVLRTLPRAHGDYDWSYWSGVTVKTAR